MSTASLHRIPQYISTRGAEVFRIKRLHVFFGNNTCITRHDQWISKKEISTLNCQFHLIIRHCQLGVKIINPVSISQFGGGGCNLQTEEVPFLIPLEKGTPFTYFHNCHFHGVLKKSNDTGIRCVCAKYFN